ncbi:MAG: hypothetical protein NZ874_00320, partial [Fimbriimonadales bacterium]|nr:hypothetical protein [Fimbriimonadales bacterium]
LHLLRLTALWLAIDATTLRQQHTVLVISVVRHPTAILVAGRVLPATRRRASCAAVDGLLRCSGHAEGGGRARVSVRNAVDCGGVLGGVCPRAVALVDGLACVGGVGGVVRVAGLDGTRVWAFQAWGLGLASGAGGGAWVGVWEWVGVCVGAVGGGVGVWGGGVGCGVVGWGALACVGCVGWSGWCCGG